MVHVYGAPIGDGSPLWCGPIAYGDRESCRVRGRCLCSAYGGSQPPTARAQLLGEQRFLPTRWLLSVQRLHRLAVPSSAGPLAWGTMFLAQLVVAARGAPVYPGGL